MTKTIQTNDTILKELKATARDMVAPGKGILAADENGAAHLGKYFSEMENP